MDVYALTSSSFFKGATTLFSLASILAFVGLAGFVLYVLTQPALRRPDGDRDEWIVLFSTLRDFFAAYLLYVAVDFLRGLGGTESIQPYSQSPVAYVQAFSWFIDKLLLGLIAFIAGRRLWMLHRWLESKRGG